ncbi:MAG: hypothetical protein Q7S65_01310 [Nanoarchaeota archaeon]|nr:hypothetical protein [Nanoarchaeota archaeon]
MLTKESLKEFLAEKWDIKIEDILQEFNLPKKEVPQLTVFLGQLEEEKWIRKSKRKDGTFEYDPGEAQEELE